MNTPDGMGIVSALVALEAELPPLRGWYEYVVAASGLYIRSADAWVDALVPVALSASPLPGLALVQPYAQLRVPRVPESWLAALVASAKRAMPAEAMYQLVPDALAINSRGGWAAHRPPQRATPGRVTFADVTPAAVDVHSHHSMAAFFSGTDNQDEQGLRFYCVLGRLDTRPEIAARVGVYGHTMRVPALAVFDGLGPCVDTLGRCRVCGCTETQACEGGCSWVEEDLCSRCAETEIALDDQS